MNPNDKKQIASADRIAKSVERLYHQLIGQVVGLYGEGLVFDPKEVFHFANSPIINALVTKIFAHHTEKIIGNIQAETKRQWLSSVEKNTQIVQGFLQGAEVSSEKMKIYTSRNLEALARFQQRKTNGLNLSERIWKYSDQLKIELEMALDLGLREGRSARQLSRDIRQYLHEPNLLFRRVKDTHGNLHLSKRAEKMQVGQGVYRSAYKNAMRVARTEVNMAYRAADMEKYRQLDFVLGYEVKRSNRLFGCPVCEALKGKYPKDFQFLGWHPQCRCYTTPILNDLEEFITHQQTILDGRDYTPSRQITDVPDNFKHWITDNRERLERAKSLPLFVSDNKRYAQARGKEKVSKTLRRAKDKELKEWVKQNIPEKSLVVKGKQFKNNEIIINRAGAKSVYSHFTEPHLKDLVKDIENIVKKGQFKSEVSINKEAHNYTKKIKAGYESFRYYIAQHKGYNIRINTAIVMGEEKVYSINLLTTRKSP